MSDTLLFRPGVLSKLQIQTLTKEGALQNVEDKNIDESSFDVTLSEDYYEMDHAIRPKEKESYRKAFGSKKSKKIKRGGVRLRKGHIYVFALREIVDFSQHEKLCGVATGKSSLGRLDLLVRLIADNKWADCYDYVPTQQDGSPLYIEIIPMTFDVIVDEGFPISQLRLFVGAPELNKISNRLLEKIYKDDLLRTEGGVPYYKEKEFSKRLTVNLKPDERLKGSPSAFCAKRKTEPIDLAELEKFYNAGEKEKLLDPHKYWEISPCDGKSLVLMEEDFYILRSCERLYLPGYVAVGCEAVKEELGELRIHYAGFAHPGFGRKRGEGDEKGTPLIFEVRGHNFKTCLRHGEALASLEFFRMSWEVPVDKCPRTKYDTQELQLSKYFKDWK